MTTTYQIITDCLVQDFEVPADRVAPGATLDQLDLDSLSLVELSLIVEERLGLAAADIRQDITLAELAALAERAAPSEPAALSELAAPSATSAPDGPAAPSAPDASAAPDGADGVAPQPAGAPGAQR
ncbi:acyl carrier protein [Streptomyces sp. NPDC013181]|uniref:acyl carrier protein n=1 Tax=unclassified Streptomyces TaxID=2593676 RepID=UPI00369C9C3D